MYIIQIILLVACLSIQSNGFGRGPPWKMCSLLIPKHHGLQQQTSDPPYEIILSKTTYTPNETISVTIMSQDGTPFRGFILGARPVDGDTENVVGSFIDIPSNAKGASWYASAHNVYNCVSHNSKTDKLNVTLKWRAPSSNVGAVIFSTAIVKDFQTFWANVSSKLLPRQDGSSPPPFESSVKPGFSGLDLNSCGKDKGCILYPKYCEPKQCEWVVTFKKINTTHVDFEMIGVSPGYISLGLSDDRYMSIDGTTSCTISKDKQFLSVQNGYNPAYNNERHRIIGFTNIELTRFDEKIYCRFRRPIDVIIATVSVNSSNLGTYTDLSYNLNKRYYVFLAVGKLYDGTDVLGKHVEEPLITSEKVDLLGKEIYYPSVFPVMVQLHGTFMLMAWMLSAGLGIILAGHFKDMITKMACGAQLWFQLHRGIMSFVAIFTTLGLIMIFVFQKEWKERSQTHGAVGLTAVGLMVIQIFIGIIRPAPDSKRRPIFKWAHVIMGYSAMRLSGIAFLLAFVMTHIPPTLRYYNAIVFGIWIGIQIIWEIIFRLISYKFRRDQSSAVVSTDLKSVQVETSNESQEFKKKKQTILFTALVIYIITLLVFFSVSIALFLIY